MFPLAHNTLNLHTFDKEKKPFMVSPRTPLPALCISGGAKGATASLGKRRRSLSTCSKRYPLPEVFTRARNKKYNQKKN